MGKERVPSAPVSTDVPQGAIGNNGSGRLCRKIEDARLELMQSTNMLSLQPAALVDKYVRRGLLTRIADELPDRMPDYGLITPQGEPPRPAALAFMDVIRHMAYHDTETASAAISTRGA